MMPVLPLFLSAALLWGSGVTQPPEETLPPALPAALETFLLEDYGGRLQTTPLNLTSVQGLHFWNGDLLLLSGRESTTLTLLDADTLEEKVSVVLSFPVNSSDVRFHPDGTLSCFDADRNETVILNRQLSDIRRIPAPGGLTGPPILWGNTLYYCTATHLRSWELDTGIRRCIKEMSFDTQVLTDVLLDGTVLQCSVTDAGAASSLFLSAEDGRQLYTGTGSYDLQTRQEHYYAVIPAGYNRLPVLGHTHGTPLLLTPETPATAVYFLPEAGRVITEPAAEAGTPVRLECYDFDTGTLQDTLVLDPFQQLTAAASREDLLYLLVHDPAESRELLLRWKPETSVGESRLSALHDADISLLQSRIEDLEEVCGIRLHITGAQEPPEYTFEEEVRPALLDAALQELEQGLRHFPEAVLRQTAAHFSAVNLHIVRSITGPQGASTGLQYLDGSEAHIVIAAGPYAGQALYHQLFHLMETHIFSNSKTLDQWEELNPAGFRYDYDYTANILRDSGVYLFREYRAFTDTFAMSFPREDRARILEYAMLPGQEELFRTEVMQKKLYTICTGIREAYDLEDTTTPFLWEQYLD